MEVCIHLGLPGRTSCPVSPQEECWQGCVDSGFFTWKQKRGLEWGGVHRFVPMGQDYRGLPWPCGPVHELPIRGAGGCCLPVITDDIRELVFQIGFPVLPAASGANSTGRITQVAARLRECGLYKHNTNKKVKRRTAPLLRASEWGKWDHVLREGPTFLNTPTGSTTSCHSKPSSAHFELPAEVMDLFQTRRPLLSCIIVSDISGCWI